LQLCVTPPFVGGQQPFVEPSQIPFLQPPIPAIRPIPVPGSNTLFGTKFPWAYSTVNQDSFSWTIKFWSIVFTEAHLAIGYSCISHLQGLTRLNDFL
jgi:hypothetical protein